MNPMNPFRSDIDALFELLCQVCAEFAQTL